MSKPHSLFRMKGKLANTPHLIEQTSFNTIMEYFDKRADADIDLKPKAWFDDDEAPRAPVDPHAKYYDDSTKTAVMYIEGPLTAKTSGWEALCGGTSYEMLKSQMQSFVNYGAKTVAMIQDSGGGEAHGMMDSANYVRKLADENGIKLISYVDGMSASASYGWSVIADEIIMSADSQVGSVGVLIQLMNNSKALEKAGYERTFITAGKDKVPFAEDGSFTSEFKERLQGQVDTLYDAFTSHVATHRSMTQDAVKATEANVFLAKEAIELGMADKVMTVEEFYGYLASMATYEEPRSVNKSIINKLSTEEEAIEMAQLEDLQATLEAKEALLSGSQEAVAALTAQLTSQSEKLESVMAQLDALHAEKAQAKVDSRKAALAEQLPADQVEANLSALSGLDDGAFAIVLKTMTATKEKRVEEMTELGGDGAELSVADAQDTQLDAIRAAGVARAKQMARQ